MTQASAGVGNTPNTAAGMRGKAGPGRKGSRLDAPVRVVDLGVVAAAEYADPVEVGDQVSAAPARSGPMQQKERLEGGGRASDGDPDDSARSSAVVEAVDLTQSPPPPFQPIIIEDTPTRQERGEERELVDLTASTPRPSVGEMRRVTTIDRDLELARRLQEEEEQALRATSQSSSSSSAGPEAIDEDLLLARRLQEEEDAEIARRLLQSARERVCAVCRFCVARFVDCLAHRCGIVLALSEQEPRRRRSRPSISTASSVPSRGKGATGAMRATTGATATTTAGERTSSRRCSGCRWGDTTHTRSRGAGTSPG